MDYGSREGLAVNGHGGNLGMMQIDCILLLVADKCMQLSEVTELYSTRYILMHTNFNSIFKSHYQIVLLWWWRFNH